MRRAASVLVVDDEAIVCESCRRVLAAEGHAVCVAGSADEAMQLLESQRFDVVLLDIRLPGFNGLKLLRAIRKVAPQSDIVVITGFPSLENAKESIRLGAFDYVTKPLTPRVLCDVVSNILTCRPWKAKERYRHGVFHQHEARIDC